VQQTRQPSRADPVFLDAQFPAPPRPRTRRDASALPRRDRRRDQEPAFAPLTERFGHPLTDWRHDPPFGIVVMIGIAVVAGVIWYRIGIGGASAGESGDAPAAVSTSAPSTTLAESTATDGVNGKDRSATIAVHVAGAVNHPGVVELRTGARVIDAVEAVGGALGDGDLDRLNLAAKVTDGQRVYVAKVGQSDPGAVDGTGATASVDPTASAASGGKVNLNTATEAQLEELPGIGPTYAQAILAERQRKGGFTSVNDLRSVRGIGDKRFAELAPLVTV
jgi:competence protein ComEA